LALGSSAGAPGPRRRDAALPPADSFFLKVMSCRWKNREAALLLVRIRRLRSSAMVSSKVRSDCSAMRANICSACRSNRETLPPRGFGAQRPLPSHPPTAPPPAPAQTPNPPPPPRRIPPPPTPSTPPLRKKTKKDSGTPPPTKENQSQNNRPPQPPGKPRRFKSAGKS